ncbi:hypothetical protein GA707_16435 [Nostocoides sp. F2B08]|uniref:hypothetical protein n=1 Tax=Nostocoides sp. F2B08 TaxID=2653936 RepID=UPI001263247B|nr:hypothetical protein [Tetrasphaera sp. F2B08]KAB7742481.1 hypothetical protein GA707_16435 [Tetrasphaera sp. F2B08]
MSDAYTWVCLDDGGRAVDADAGSTFPNQVEAEAWLGESWEQLADRGVAAVTLQCNGVDVYGPMSLAPGS